MRAALKLSKEKLVQLHKQKHTIVTLNEEGETYAKKGLPERHLIKSLIKLGGKAKIDKVVDDAKLKSELVPIALGWLHRKDWATIERKERTLKALKKPQKGEDEEILILLAEKGIVTTEELSKEKREAVTTLQKRKLVETEEKTSRILELTSKGRSFIKKGIKILREVSQLTPELVVTGKWRETKLRNPSRARYALKGSTQAAKHAKEDHITQLPASGKIEVKRQ